MNSEEEVLEQAKDALASHRAWMKNRRVRNSVAPASNVESESPLEEIDHSFSSKSMPFEAAPPLSRGAASVCVPVCRIKKTSRNKVVPALASSLGASHEGELTDRGEIDLSRFFVSRSCQSNDLLDGFATSSPPKIAWGNASDDLPVPTSHSRVEHDVTIFQTLPGEVAHCEIEKRPSSTSPPPYVSETMALGSLSSLDYYVDSMVSMNENDRVGACSPNGQPYPGNNCGVGDNGSNKEACDCQGGKDTPIYQVPLGIREQNGVEILSPKSNNGSCQNEEESITNEGDFRSLRKASSATLVAVNPAPRERRTTFATHKLSKLDSAEAGGNVYDFEFSSRTTGSETLTTIAYNNLPGRGEKGVLIGGIPEANVKLVLPQLEAKKRVSRSARRIDPQPAFSSNRSMTIREDEAKVNNGVQMCREKVLEESRGENLAKRHNKPTTMETPVTVEGNDVVLVREESKGMRVAPIRKCKSMKRKGIETQVKSINPMEGSHHTRDNTHMSAGHGEGNSSSLLWNMSSVPSHSQAAKTVYLPTVSSVAVEVPKVLHDTDITTDGAELEKGHPTPEIVSPLSVLLTGSANHMKYNRRPPVYDIHRPSGGFVLSPPCPLYGEKQPPENEKFASQRGWQKTDGIYPVPVTSQGSSTNQIHGQPLTSHSLSEVTERPSSHHLSSSSSPTMISVSSLPQGPGPLHIAAKLGNLRRLQAMLDQGHNVDVSDHLGRTPLMYCIQSQGVHLSCADTLMKSGANLDKQSSDGATALHHAASSGALALLQLLLLNNAKPDLQDVEGRHPIHWATLQKNPKIFTALLKNLHPSGGVLECTDDAGMTVLMWAAYHNNHAIVSFLLNQGADTAEKDKDGCTAMHCCRKCIFPISSSVESDPRPVIMIGAIHRDSSHTLQLLLKPDMTYFKDYKGKTIMHTAAERGSMDACEVVLKLRPDAIHDRDKKGHTPLHYAAACSRVNVSALLLDCGADASQKDAMSKTPLDYAREKKLDYVVALLSCHGNAVSDFARASRSLRASSVISPSISFNQLPQICREQADDEDIVPIVGSGGIFSHSVLSLSSSGSATPDAAMSVNNVSAGCAATDLIVTKGGYLGMFFPEQKELIRHYYFCLDEEEGSIAWSRSRDGFFRTASKALVLEAYNRPRNDIKNHPKFSATALHCYSFWVGTSYGILDLLAYNEDTYEEWLMALKRVAQRNTDLNRNSTMFNVGAISRGRPLSCHFGSKLASRSAVSPGGVAMAELDISSTNGCGTMMDTSVFVRDRKETSSKDISYDHMSISLPSPMCPP